MNSSGWALCLTAAAMVIGTAESGIAEISGGLRPMARPATLAMTATDAEAAAIVTDVSATADIAAPAPQGDPETGAELASTDGLARASGPVLGPATNLPVPRFVSLKTDEVNVRRGPSLSHRIDWVFTREDMPLQITAEYGHWRRVVDRDGLGGWVHYSLVSGTRTVIVDQDMLPLLARPAEGASENARLEQGVIARLGECNIDWCRISAGGYRGWVQKTALWGVEADEIRE